MTRQEAIRLERLKDRALLALDMESEFVLSPCIGVCEVHKRTQTCVGCFRSMEDIVRWTAYSNFEKRAIWSQIMMRVDQA